MPQSLGGCAAIHLITQQSLNRPKLARSLPHHQYPGMFAYPQQAHRQAVRWRSGPAESGKPRCASASMPEISR